MLLPALTLAVLLQAAPPPDSFARAPQMDGQRSALECRQRATKTRDDAVSQAQPLNRMPMGIGERAVMRMVDGCPVRAPIVRRVP